MQIRKIIRNINIEILLIIGLSLMVFITYNASDLLMKIKKEQRTKEVYNNTIYFSIEPKELEKESEKNCNFNLDDLVTLLKDEQCNVCIFNYPVYVGDSLNTYGTDIYLVNNDNSNTFDAAKCSNPQVAVGKDMKNCMYTENETQYINIMGQRCEVGWILENVTASQYDDRVRMYYSNVNKETKEKLNAYLQEEVYWGKIINIKIEGNKDISATYKKLNDYLLDNYDVTSTIDENTKNANVFNTFYVGLNKVFFVILLIFALINCIAISDLWISQRANELVIRRAFGYSKDRIIIYLLSEIMKLTLIAVVFAFFIQIIYSLITEGLSVLTIDTLLKMLLTLVGMLVAILITMVPSIRKVVKMDVATLVQKI